MNLACMAVQALHSKIADARYTEVDRLYFSYVFRLEHHLQLQMLILNKRKLPNVAKCVDVYKSFQLSVESGTHLFILFLGSLVLCVKIIG